jgi:kynureninase
VDGGAAVAGLTRAHAEALDAADPLARFRERFVLDDDRTEAGRIYLDGNSLGRLPLATRARLAALAEEWGERLVTAWPDWIDLPVTVGDLLAEGVLGARAGEVVVTDSTTVNLFKLVGALLADRPGAVATDRGNFPTDRYVLEGTGRELRDLVAADPLHGPGPEDVARLVAGGDVALLVLSHVDYRSGAVADIAAIEAAAGGVPVVWDLSHSAGAIPVELGSAGARYAVGCTYKHLNGGPGSPAYLYVRSDAQDGLRTLIQGWFAQREQFAMDRPFDPEPGIRGFLAGTPPILQLAAVQEGARLSAEAGPAALGEKIRSLTGLIVAHHDDHLEPLGFSLGSPRAPERRGAHVALRHPEGWPISQALTARGVVGDFRGPDVVRLGVAPLYTTHVEVFEALERLRALVERGEHRGFDAAPGRVT